MNSGVVGQSAYHQLDGIIRSRADEVTDRLRNVNAVTLNDVLGTTDSYVIIKSTCRCGGSDEMIPGTKTVVDDIVSRPARDSSVDGNRTYNVAVWEARTQTG